MVEAAVWRSIKGAPLKNVVVLSCALAVALEVEKDEQPIVKLAHTTRTGNYSYCYYGALYVPSPSISCCLFCAPMY